MGDHYMLYFAPALRLLRSQIVCRPYNCKVFRLRLYTEAPRVNTHAKRSHKHVKDPVVHVRVRWIMEIQ